MFEGMKIQKPLRPNTIKVVEQATIKDENGKEVTVAVPKEKPNDAQNTYQKYREFSEWCNQRGYIVKDYGDYYSYEVPPKPTEEELQAQALAQAKAERAEAVEALTVEVNGNVYDADETSQARMSVAASSMTDYETNVWVLHDNSIVHVTKSELLDACRKARLAQSAIWTKPYEDATA